MFCNKAIIDDAARIGVNITDGSFCITLIYVQNWLNKYGKYVKTFDVLEGAEKAQELLNDDCSFV